MPLYAVQSRARTSAAVGRRWASFSRQALRSWLFPRSPIVWWSLRSGPRISRPESWSSLASRFSIRTRGLTSVPLRRSWV
nr:hypothetical protein [Miltoncostaea marina]